MKPLRISYLMKRIVDVQMENRSENDHLDEFNFVNSWTRMDLLRPIGCAKLIKLALQSLSNSLIRVQIPDQASESIQPLIFVSIWTVSDRNI